ncbi:MAG: triple tyrosine motif-containing protein [Sphingomonas sp.]|uniref:sensor histidine kinase n=1 Tax=Sphingomonas sp. TaxID=28214 RepID=UPI002276D27C|nr:sensor histidine kinase [Sphingomonas sp.]MCX8478016.1 triple tyrosine motif-containing protein [Sphingomonas sp.]
MLLVAGLAALAAALPARAQIPRLGFDQFKHTRWTIDDGAPISIVAIAQTPDGYLWLGTLKGLYRFDGVTFEFISPPAGSRMERKAVGSLWVTRSGELWVGYGFAGIAAYRGGSLVDLGVPNPASSNWPIVETPDGAIWVAFRGRFSEKRLTRLFKGRWELVAEPLGLPAGSISAMAAGPDGGLWISVTRDEDSSLVYLPRGGSRFLPAPYPQTGAQQGLATDRIGRLWLSDRSGVRVLLDRNGKPPAARNLLPVVPEGSFRGMLFDRHGGIWGTTGEQGLYYLSVDDPTRRSPDDRLWRFGNKQGLTSDLAYTQFIDAEGSVWIGTASGLDRFRPVNAWPERAIPTQDGVIMAGSTDGSVYGMSSEGLYLIAPGQVPRRIRDGEYTIICKARDRGIWAIEADRVYRFVGDRVTQSFAMPPGDELAGVCAEGRDGLFIRLMSMKMMRHDAHGWHVVTEADAANRSDEHWDFFPTPEGDIAYWANDNLVRLRGDRKRVTSLRSAKVAPFVRIWVGPREIYLAGDGGLLRVRGDELRSISAARFPWAGEVSGLVQTSHGQSWLMGDNTIYMVATADLERAFEDPRAPLALWPFDIQDGPIEGLGPRNSAGEKAVLGGDGRIWFETSKEPILIDPAKLLRNTVPPGVAIRSVTVGERSFRDPADLVLPPGTRSLDIAYAGLSLAVPQRVQFRYRLEGVDDDWVDPGTRRLASYANLGPGSYRFQVIASNNDGVWNRTGATLRFEIQPTFFQSTWFLLIELLGAGLLLWILVSIRIRHVSNRLRAALEVRLAERERIARELHDTLLQGFQGLVLRFQSMVNQLSEDEAQKPALNAALDRAEDVLVEGRQRVQALRSATSDLTEMLMEAANDMAAVSSAAFELTTEGRARPLHPVVREEVQRIGEEAIRNAFKHAQASRVEVVLSYLPGTLRLRIDDDGVGLPPEVAATGGREGHFGLAGMRERAKGVGGSLAVDSSPGQGTQVELTIPGDAAYADATRGWLAGLRSRFFRRSG